jgi:hypothetical protein
MRKAILIPVFLICLTLNLYTSNGQNYSGLHKTVNIPGDPSNCEYSLGSPFVLAGSDSIAVGDHLLVRDEDYAINYDKGIIYLAAAPKPGDTLTAHFNCFSLVLPEQTQYLPLLPDTLAKEDEKNTGQAGQLKGGLEGWKQGRESQLQFGGNKSVAINMGNNRDLTLEQSLNVMVNGKLGTNLEVAAMLSDQGMPVSGSTQELSQIDKVYIKATSSDWSATVGDYDLSYHRQALLNVHRQLQGLDASISRKENKISFAVSSTKGKPGYNTLIGRDGVQGPYQLSVVEGGIFRVLANSDRVWLDGKLMQRGSDRDYTIDYENPQIKFSPRQLITSDSRITVEFEYSQESFARDLYFISSDIQAGDHLSFNGAYYSESDDPLQPSIGEMDEAWKRVLSAAGDDTAGLWGDGGTPADSGNGDYDKIDSIYVYAGKGLGNYMVTFTWQGSGRGDYIYNGTIGAFVYVGHGNGDYSALKKYSRPEQFKSLGLQVRSQWSGGDISVNGAKTWKDVNLLSSLDDSDNSGGGVKYDVVWRRDSLRWGGFEFGGRGVYYGDNFCPELSNPESDFEIRWGLNNWSGLKKYDYMQNQHSQEYNGNYWPNRAFKLGGGWGQLGLGRDFWSRKYRASVNFFPWPWSALTYRYQNILLGQAWEDVRLISSKRQEHQAEAEAVSGKLTWQLGIDDRLDDNLYVSRNSIILRTTEGFGGISVKGAKIKWNSRYSRREDKMSDSIEQSWKGLSHTDQIKSLFKYDLGEHFILSIDHTYYSKIFRPGAVGQNQKSNLAMLKADGFGKAVKTGMEYSLNSTEARSVRDIYIKVPDETGDYSFDSLSGVYYPDTSGNYLRQILEEGPVGRASEVSARGYFQFSPEQLSGNSWWTGLRINLTAISSVKSLGAVTPELLTMLPAGQSRPQDLSSSMDFSGDAGYLGRSGWSARFILRWRRDRDNQILFSQNVRRDDERKMELRYVLSKKVTALLEGYSNSARTYNMNSGLESSIEPSAISTEFILGLNSNIDCNPKAEIGKERMMRYNLPIPLTNYQHWSLTAGLTRKLSLYGQVRVESGFIYRKADLMLDDIPFEFRYTRPLGRTLTWRTTYDYRISSYFTMSASYDGRKEEDKNIVHNGRMEVRAYF